MKRAVVIFADGFEELEAVAPIDILRRANVDVLTVGLTGTTVVGAHGLVVHAEQSFDDYEFSGEDAIIIPGGADSAQALSESARLVDIINRAVSEGKIVAAICASAALVLGKAAGILSERKYTCYPGYEQFVENGTHVKNEGVVVDGNVITSNGAGSSISFSLEILRHLSDEQTVTALASALCIT